MTVPPHLWGRLMAGLDTPTFRRRLAHESDVARLRAAATHEHERADETRGQRIAWINQRIAKVRE